MRLFFGTEPKSAQDLYEMQQAASWRDASNVVLRRLFVDRLPTDQEIFDAYPFGMRQYWPYKVWREQVRWWKAGCPVKSHAGPIRRTHPLPGQEVLL